MPLIILAGKEYGTGSSRDWAAKGPLLQGVRAVIAVSFERIHRSNLIGMGILPLEFTEGQNAQLLTLDGSETYDLPSLKSMEVNAPIHGNGKKRGERDQVQHTKQDRYSPGAGILETRRNSALCACRDGELTISVPAAW